MGFASIREYVDAIEAGQSTLFGWRKAPTQVTLTGIWFDMSMSPGNPVPEYYASTPLVAAVRGSPGLNVGLAVSPATKHLKTVSVYATAATALPLQMRLCDYLLYYPFIDMGATTEQTLDNTVTLPRYTDGDGVQIIAVQVAAQIGGQQFYVTYTNQDGVAGRVSRTVTCNTTTVIGALIQTNRTMANTGGGPFIPLQVGDTGVRSIQSLTMLGADVGLITLVLVKPLASMQLRELTAPVEVDFMRDRPSLPRIYDGAYLNWLVHPVGSLAATSLLGVIEAVWR